MNKKKIKTKYLVSQIKISNDIEINNVDNVAMEKNKNKFFLLSFTTIEILLAVGGWVLLNISDFQALINIIEEFLCFTQ